MWHELAVGGKVLLEGMEPGHCGQGKLAATLLIAYSEYPLRTMQQFSDSESEKIALEHQAARLFMRSYERQTGKRIRHIWHNPPRRPDVSCLLEGERLDLEIAHLYGSEQEAMHLLGRELSEHTRQELEALDRVEDAHSRLIEALNRILANKALKYYQSRRVWLVIRNVHPAWTAEEISASLHQIEIPPEHPFEQIWIVGDMQGKSGIVQLYPRPLEG